MENMCRFLVNIGSKVRVITNVDTEKKKKERIGKIVATTENFVVVKYARGYRECFGFADVIAPAGLKILAWNGSEWRDVKYERGDEFDS